VVWSACIPRKKPQAKKSPSALSVETEYELTPSEASEKTKSAQNHFPEATAIGHIKRHNVTINQNRIEIYCFRSIAIERQSERPSKILTQFQFSARSATGVQNGRLQNLLNQERPRVEYVERGTEQQKAQRGPDQKQASLLKPSSEGQVLPCVGAQWCC
jgi:hypothetical protein